MNNDKLIALVDRLRALLAETEWFEFKRNRHEPQAIGEYLSALANAACLANQPRGYLVFGIDNDTHAVVGTRFDPAPHRSCRTGSLWSRSAGRCEIFFRSCAAQERSSTWGADPAPGGLSRSSGRNRDKESAS